MSRNTHIFVRSETTLDDLAAHLGYLFNQRLEYGENVRERWYLYVTDYNVIDLLENTTLNDLGIPFEDYNYVICIREKRIQGINRQASEHHRLAESVEIFDVLKTTGLYSLMLVDDLHVKLEEHVIDGE